MPERERKRGGAGTLRMKEKVPHQKQHLHVFKNEQMLRYKPDKIQTAGLLIAGLEIVRNVMCVR